MDNLEWHAGGWGWWWRWTRYSRVTVAAVVGFGRILMGVITGRVLPSHEPSRNAPSQPCDQCCPAPPSLACLWLIYTVLLWACFVLYFVVCPTFGLQGLRPVQRGVLRGQAAGIQRDGRACDEGAREGDQDAQGSATSQHRELPRLRSGARRTAASASVWTISGILLSAMSHARRVGRTALYFHLVSMLIRC